MFESRRGHVPASHSGEWRYEGPTGRLTWEGSDLYHTAKHNADPQIREQISLDEPGAGGHNPVLTEFLAALRAALRSHLTRPPTFAAGTWKVNVVQGGDWAEGINPWHFVIEGQDRSAAPYAFPLKQGAVRLRQRVLAFVKDSPF